MDLAAVSASVSASTKGADLFVSYKDFEKPKMLVGRDEKKAAFNGKRLESKYQYPPGEGYMKVMSCIGWVIFGVTQYNNPEDPKENPPYTFKWGMRGITEEVYQEAKYETVNGKLKYTDRKRRFKGPEGSEEIIKTYEVLDAIESELAERYVEIRGTKHDKINRIVRQIDNKSDDLAVFVEAQQEVNEETKEVTFKTQCYVSLTDTIPFLEMCKKSKNMRCYVEFSIPSILWAANKALTAKVHTWKIIRSKEGEDLFARSVRPLPASAGFVFEDPPPKRLRDAESEGLEEVADQF